MKTILGLDLGTNSIGWALINQNFERKDEKIIDLKEGTIIDKKSYRKIGSMLTAVKRLPATSN